MKNVKFDIRAMSATAKADLSKVLKAKGVYRVERGSKHAVVGSSSAVWESQNGLFVYVSETGQLTQGYSESVFKKCLHPEFVAVEYEAQGVVAFIPA